MGVVKKGCLGCGILVGLLVVLVGMLIGLAWVGARGAEETSTTLTPAIPMALEAGSVELGPSSVELSATDGVADRPAAAGLVEVDFRHGELIVRPAAAGEGLHVVATYDEQSHTLSEKLTVDDSGKWCYRVDFSGDSGGVLGLLRQAFSGLNPRLVVFLPNDIPLDLDLDVAQGGGELELGGLWLRSAEITARQGGYEIKVSEPLRAPMESLRIDAGMGGFSAARLGNASPSVLEMKIRMGGAEIDLRGDWRNDAIVRINASMGGASVRLPRAVNLSGAPGHDREGAEAPTLQLEIESSQGEVELID